MFHHFVNAQFDKIKFNLIDLKELELWGQNLKRKQISSPFFFFPNIKDWLTHAGDELLSIFSSCNLFFFIWSFFNTFIWDLT
jgi:hypothetical protein